MRRAAVIALALGAALVLPSVALAAGAIDQSQEVVSCGTGGGPGTLIAQTFTAGTSGSLVAVALFPTGGAGAGKAGVGVELHDIASGGEPGTTVLASTTIKTNVREKLVKVSFRTPAAVTAGTQYAIVLVPTIDSAIFGCAQHDLYAGGNLYAKVDQGWFQEYDEGTTVPWDLTFRTYVN